MELTKAQFGLRMQIATQQLSNKVDQLGKVRRILRALKPY